MNNINAQNDIKDFFCVDTILKIDKILLKDISSREIVFEVKNDVIIFFHKESAWLRIPIPYLMLVHCLTAEWIGRTEHNLR